jgi:hypothetical protein
VNNEKTRHQAAAGRYDLKDASPPPEATPLPRSRRRISVTTAAVPIPRPFAGSERGERQLVSVNYRIDLLENERKLGRISEAAYREGGRLLELLEAAHRIGGTNWSGGDRIDAYTAHETAIVKKIETAQEITAVVAWVRSRLGAYDTQILRWVLGDRMTFMNIAARTGPATERRAGYVAQRFRDALQSLADARAAVGVKKQGV